MATTKKLEEKIKQTLARAKVRSKIAILQMPEYSPDTAPHWLFWLLVIGLIALMTAVIGARTGLEPTIQAYLPVL